MGDYSLLDRVLHRVALQVASIAELSFDMDQRTVRGDPQDIVDEQHVFVSGLARAGTTVLMRSFHASGAYRSLTYRDMPFVLAPNLWRRLARISARRLAATERAHRDRILVDADSPESLDEVFWRIFCGAEYIGATHLRPHSPEPDIVEKYIHYVSAILNVGETGSTRYLSKNNNNILRLSTIRRAFPRALILVPFRDPLAQAASLLRQHLNLKRMQTADPFVRAYMTWLAHHEFGHDHRPMRFDHDDPVAPATNGTDRIEYWLGIWCATYQWLQRSAPLDAVFISYEELCDDPVIWSRLAEIAGIAGISDKGDSFASSHLRPPAIDDVTLAERASAIHANLTAKAHSALK